MLCEFCVRGIGVPSSHICATYQSITTSDGFGGGSTVGEAALRPIDALQKTRMEDDGVLVAQLGESFLGRALATCIKTRILGISTECLVLMATGAQSERRVNEIWW